MVYAERLLLSVELPYARSDGGHSIVVAIHRIYCQKFTLANSSI
jgi:hypothetical protein